MGSFSILNNPAAINGQHQLNLNNVNLGRTLQRMSSGMRINTGADDAAGLQIADSLRANVYALNQGVRNANDGISYLQIADGALAEITNLLTRAVTLASQAATETVDQLGRDALNNEFQTIQQEIARIATDTNFNGSRIFDRDREFKKYLDLFVGDLSVGAIDPATFDTNSVNGYISVKIGFIDVVTLTGDDTRNKIGGFGFEDAGVANGSQASLSTVNLLTHTNASSAFVNIRESLNAIATMRGDIGAGMNRLQAAISVMQTQSRNTLAAESAIRDANMAEEITNLTKFQILAQTGISALSHANTNSQIVLRLLQ
jgi:flagellin